MFDQESDVFSSSKTFERCLQSMSVFVSSTVLKYILEHTHKHTHRHTHSLVLNSFVENVNGSDLDFQPFSIPALFFYRLLEEALIFVPFTQWKSTWNLLLGVPFCLLFSLKLTVFHLMDEAVNICRNTFAACVFQKLIFVWIFVIVCWNF